MYCVNRLEMKFSLLFILLIVVVGEPNLGMKMFPCQSSFDCPQTIMTCRNSVVNSHSEYCFCPLSLYNEDGTCVFDVAIIVWILLAVLAIFAPIVLLMVLAFKIGFCSQQTGHYLG